MYLVNKQNEECYINMRRATMRANGEGKLYYVLRREIRLEWLTMTHAQKSIWLASTKQTQQIDQVAEDKPWMLGGYPTANIKSALRKELETAPACLFTFNSGWLMGEADWCALVRELQDCPAELELQARKRQDTMALFYRFYKQTNCFGKWADWKHWSVSLEISLDAESLGRVHLHAFGHFKEASFANGHKAMRFGFDNTHPNRQWCKGVKGAGGREGHQERALLLASSEDWPDRDGYHMAKILKDDGEQQRRKRFVAATQNEYERCHGGDRAVPGPHSSLPARDRGHDASRVPDSSGRRLEEAVQRMGR